MVIKNVDGVEAVDSLFKTSFEDDDASVFKGRKRPRDPERSETSYLMEDEFNNIESWEVTTSGTGTGATVSGGVVTLNSGTTDDGYTKLVHKKNIKGHANNGSMIVEFRARGNYSAISKQEWFVGIWKNSGLDPPGGEDFGVGGYNVDEGGNTYWVNMEGGGTSGAGYTDNTWKNYKLTIFESGKITLESDGASLATDTLTAADSDDMYVVIWNQTRANPGVNQTLEIDWIRVRKSA